MLWRNDGQAHAIDTSSPSWRAGAGADLHILFAHWLISCVLLFRCLPGPRSPTSSAGPDDILDALLNVQVRTCDSPAWFSAIYVPRVGCSRSISLFEVTLLPSSFTYTSLSLPHFSPNFFLSGYMFSHSAPFISRFCHSTSGIPSPGLPACKLVRQIL